MNILDEIIKYKKIQIETEKQIKSYKDYEKEFKKIEDIRPRNFCKELKMAKDIAIISEIKKASPSKGIIKEDFDLVETVNAYEKKDFTAYSVLTEKKYFKGSDEYIKKVKELSNRPVLRKDFIIDEYQIIQSRVIGADAILLIANVLKNDLKHFFRMTRDLGLHPLVEIHSEEDIKYVEQADPYLIGINNRNLETFETDLRHTEKIMDLLPKDKFIISESGINNRQDIEYLKNIGVRGVLVGESLMRNLSNLEKVF